MCPSFFSPPCCIQKTNGVKRPVFLRKMRMVSLGAGPPRYGLIGGSGVQAEGHMVRKNHISSEQLTLLLMVQKSVVHQLAGRLSHYLQRSIHPRWLLGISEPSTVGHLLYTRDSPFTQGLFHKT